MNTLLDIKNLSVSYPHKEGFLTALSDINFSVKHGDIIGVAGESGSGKSTLALTILNLVSFFGAETKGEILFEQKNLLKLHDDALRQIRGKTISLIFQNPWNVLDPLFTIENQFKEFIQAHHKDFGQEEIKKIIISSLSYSQLPSNENFLSLYPHQLSGGMLQRVAIAMATALSPKLLIADEPTSSLDVTTQAEIIRFLKKIWEKKNMSIIFISHDLALLSQICHSIIIIKDGKLIENAPTKEIFLNPKEDYTKKLLNSIPKIEF